MRNDASMTKVGLTVLLAVIVLAAAILVIGERSFLFTSTSSYSVRFENVGGLDQGSPVQLNGVVVGRVKDIVLSRNVEESLLLVWIEIESKYTDRIRTDSIARIKSLGLLGDKFVQVVSGSSTEPKIEAGGEIPGGQPTDVDSLIRSGEDVADYVVSTARSLTAILGRLERGEGVVGELLAGQGGPRITESLTKTLASVDRVATTIDAGKGPVGRLISDEQLANQIATSVSTVESLLADIQDGDGMLKSLTSDQETKESFQRTLSGLETAVADLGSVAKNLKEKQGLAGRLVNDEEYATRLLERLESVVTNLDHVTGRVAQGDGSIARMINEPELYEAINDIVVGINDSKMLRWLIRNRQKQGIEKRYKAAQAETEDANQGAGFR